VRSTHGRYNFSLWSGDLGTAVYLGDCLLGGGTIPIP
jgi:hypothetical protein